MSTHDGDVIHGGSAAPSHEQSRLTRWLLAENAEPAGQQTGPHGRPAEHKRKH